MEIVSSRYPKFNEIEARIIELSRASTDARSRALSLNQKRKAMLMRQDALAAWEQAIEQEPIAGVTYGTPIRPR